MISLIKMNLKLLLRNKGLLFFLLATPLLSTFILNLKTEQDIYYENTKTAVIDMVDCKQKAIYYGDTSTYIIKAYDASGSGLAEYVLEKLVETGMFSVCRCDVSEMTEEVVLAQAKKDAFDDRAGVLLYLKTDFEQAVMDGDWQSGIQIYDVSEDERQELFENEFTDLLEQIKQAQMIVGNDSNAIVEMLDSISSQMPEKQVVSLAGQDEIELTEEQINQSSVIGYAFAIITLGFLFCGVIIAHTVIEEQNQKVFTRMMLTKIGAKTYFFSKFVVVVLICFLQTLVLAMGLFAGKNMDFGIPKLDFLLVIFLLGLIFSTLSFLVGILLGDVMNSNYAVFAIWSISALLAGLYFPLDDTSLTLKTLSYLMPQRWFMNVSKMLLTGDKGAYSVLLYVTAAYLIVIISVGSVGLKTQKTEA